MLSLVLALIVGTWNGNWFPSGRAEHRANPSVEAATIRAAGEMLASGLKRADPTGREDVVVALCEIRNRAVAEELVRAIGRADLRVASVSGYRRRDRLDQQQNAILTTLPVVSARWSNWSYVPQMNPPRGFAFAELRLGPSETVRVYAVHLKANYGAKTPKIAAENRAKRTEAIRQFLTLEKGTGPVILAGDFNADKWRKEFAQETIFASLEGAGYRNVLELLPPDERGTHPNRRYGDSALDYVMVKGFGTVKTPFLEPNDQLSDHYAVFVRIDR